MNTIDSLKYPALEPPKNPPPSSKARLKKWFHWKRDTPLAVVLRNDVSHLEVEEINDVNRKSTPATQSGFFTAEFASHRREQRL